MSRGYLPKISSWQVWHMPEMVYSFSETSSRKEEASPLQVAHDASATAPLRDTPVRLESICSMPWCLKVASREYWGFFMCVLYQVVGQMSRGWSSFFWISCERKCLSTKDLGASPRPQKNFVKHKMKKRWGECLAATDPDHSPLPSGPSP